MPATYPEHWWVFGNKTYEYSHGTLLEKRRVLSPGETFGEVALFSKEARYMETVRAISDGSSPCKTNLGMLYQKGYNSSVAKIERKR